jgi:hypothetical protein
MWLFTPDFFVSAVVDRTDADVIHVRARREHDLQALLNRHEAIAPHVTRPVRKRCPFIEHTPAADYAYRMRCSRAAWVDVVASEAALMTQTNFKDMAARRGFSAPEERRALHDVWAAMGQLQPGGPYAGATLTKPRAAQRKRA